MLSQASSKTAISSRRRLPGRRLASGVKAVRVLYIEDNPQDVEIVRGMLRKYERAKFKVVSAGTTKEGKKALRNKTFDLILLDYHLPGEDGLSFLRRLQGSPNLPPVIILTGRGDERVAVQAMRWGAYDYLPKRAITSEVLGHAIHQALEDHQFADRLVGDERFIFTLAAAVEARDLATRGHLGKMIRYAVRLGRDLGLDGPQIAILRHSAILHDIGQICVSEAILCKPGPLSEAEWQDVRLHPIVGERISVPLMNGHEVGPIIRHHHEHFDGSGYPDGLAGEQIPIASRILLVTDAFDAMTNDRPYRKAMPIEAAIEELTRHRGSQFDPAVVDAFLRVLKREGNQPQRRTGISVTETV